MRQSPYKDDDSRNKIWHAGWKAGAQDEAEARFVRSHAASEVIEYLRIYDQRAKTPLTREEVREVLSIFIPWSPWEKVQFRIRRYRRDLAAWIMPKR